MWPGNYAISSPWSLVCWLCLQFLGLGHCMLPCNALQETEFYIHPHIQNRRKKTWKYTADLTTQQAYFWTINAYFSTSRPSVNFRSHTQACTETLFDFLSRGNPNTHTMFNSCKHEIIKKYTYRTQDSIKNI